MLFAIVLGLGIFLVYMLMDAGRRRQQERRKLAKIQAEIARRERAKGTARERLPSDLR